MLPTWLEKFTCAISTNNIGYFKRLVGRTPSRWRSLKTSRRNTLLQEAIRWERKEIFTFLLGLELCDVQYLENRNADGKTAMHLAMEGDMNSEMNSVDVYYVPRLIEKYETIPDHYENLLLWAFTKNIFETTQSLLEKGMNPNDRNQRNGPTALQMAVVNRGDDNRCYDKICTLLFYGADPFLTYFDINAFEMSVILDVPSQEQEILFEYTFDKLGKYKIHYRVLLQLARLKSPLFDRILEYDVDFVEKGDDFSVGWCDFKILFCVEIDYLKIIVEKYYPLLCDIFQNSTSWNSFWINTAYLLLDSTFVETLNLLVESGETLKSNIINLFTDTWLSGRFLRFLVKDKESLATEIIIFMAQYGSIIPKEAFDLVYQAYGYCPLFKFLLHMDYVDENLLFQIKPLLIVSLIRDVHLDLDFLLPTTKHCATTNLLDVLDFYAHKKLQSFVLHKIHSEELKVPENRKELPQIPRLLELSRDVVRSYLVRRFKIKSTKEFYGIVGGLNISKVYRKIICLETKLY